MKRERKIQMRLDSFLVRSPRASPTSSPVKESGNLRQTTLESLRGVVVVEDLERAKVVLERTDVSTELKVDTLERLMLKNPAKEVLMRTGLGKTIHRMCRDKEVEVASLAQQVYKMWKEHILSKVNRPLIEVKCDLKTQKFRSSAKQMLLDALSRDNPHTEDNNDKKGDKSSVVDRKHERQEEKSKGDGGRSKRNEWAQTNPTIGEPVVDIEKKDKGQKLKRKAEAILEDKETGHKKAKINIGTQEDIIYVEEGDERRFIDQGQKINSDVENQVHVEKKEQEKKESDKSRKQERDSSKEILKEGSELEKKTYREKDKQREGDKEEQRLKEDKRKKSKYSRERNENKVKRKEEERSKRKEEESSNKRKDVESNKIKEEDNKGKEKDDKRKDENKREKELSKIKEEDNKGKEKDDKRKDENKQEKERSKIKEEKGNERKDVESNKVKERGNSKGKEEYGNKRKDENKQKEEESSRIKSGERNKRKEESKRKDAESNKMEEMESNICSHENTNQQHDSLEVLAEHMEREVYYRSQRRADNAYKRTIRSLVFALRHQQDIRTSIISSTLSVPEFIKQHKKS